SPTRPPPPSPLFPYTTLFRSAAMLARPCHVIGRRSGVPFASRAEAPEIDERAGTGIVGATAVARGVQRRLQDREAILGQRDPSRSEEHTSELQSRRDLVCRLL